MSADDQEKIPMNREVVTYNAANFLINDPNRPPVAALPDKVPERGEGYRDVSTFEGVQKVLSGRQWESPEDREFLLRQRQEYIEQAQPLLDKLETTIEGVINNANGSLGRIRESMPSGEATEKAALTNKVYEGREKVKGILGAAVNQVRLELDVEQERRALGGDTSVYDEKYERMRQQLENERFWDHDLEFGQPKEDKANAQAQNTSSGKEKPPVSESEHVENLVRDRDTNPQTPEYWQRYEEHLNDMVDDRTLSEEERDSLLGRAPRPGAGAAGGGAAGASGPGGGAPGGPNNEEPLPHDDGWTGGGRSPDRDRDAEILRRMLEELEKGRKATERSTEFNEEVLKATRKSYGAFVSAELAQIEINPAVWETNAPPWFEVLKPWQQAVIRTRLRTEFNAGIKYAKASMDLDSYTVLDSLRIEGSSLADMWKNLPGYRMAMCTITKDLFQAEPAVDSLGKSWMKLQLSEEGRSKLKNPGAYKLELIDKLTVYFQEHPEELSESKWMRQDAKTAAAGAFACAWNQFFVAAAIESGDRGRTLGADPTIVGEQVRAFLHPYDKAKNKWLKNPRGQGGEDVIDVAGTEEGWGGKIGEYYAERFSYPDVPQNAHDPVLRAQFERGENLLIPRETMFGLMDFVRFADADEAGAYRNKTWAEALLLEDKIEVGTGLWDYQTPNNIKLEMLGKGGDIVNTYRDFLDSAALLYKTVTSKEGDERNLPTRGKIIDALNRLRGDSRLRETYISEDFVTALILAKAGGPIRGISELVVAINDDNAYDQTITELTSDPRMFSGMSPDARNRIVKRLHARDLHSYAEVAKKMFGADLIGKRGRLRLKAAANMSKFLK